MPSYYCYMDPFIYDTLTICHFTAHDHSVHGTHCRIARGECCVEGRNGTRNCNGIYNNLWHTHPSTSFSFWIGSKIGRFLSFNAFELKKFKLSELKWQNLVITICSNVAQNHYCACFDDQLSGRSLNYLEHFLVVNDNLRVGNQHLVCYMNSEM